MMTKKEMLALVAYKFGLEHEFTVDFAESLEWLGLAESEALLYEVLAFPLPVSSEAD